MPAEKAGSDRAGAPAPMEGHGAYDRHSQVQAAGFSPGLPLFEQAAAGVTLPDAPAPVVIVDYGCAAGHNALVPVAAAIRVVRSRIGTERAISVVHSDVPANDFSALFQTLAGDAASYLSGSHAVFASAIGRSFYEQIVPSDSVTLGWSSWAIQWLSRAPAPIPDHVQVAYSRDAAAHAAFARQAAGDWEAFLAARARELRSGGRLVVVTMALDEAGRFGYEALLGAMVAALARLVDEGFVRADEVRRMVIPTVGRSRADFFRPFAQGGSFAGLVVESLDVFAGQDRFWEDFQRDGDARRLGAGWAGFARASVFPTLAGALEGGSADPRAADFVARLEADVAARLAADPQPARIPLARMCIART